MELKVIPEKHLPRDLTTPEHFDEKADIYPFWYIRRSIQADLVNVELVFTTVKVVSCSNFAALVKAGVKLEPAAEGYSVDRPCIVNAVPINAGDEVVIASPPKTWTIPDITCEHQVDMDNDRAVKRARRQWHVLHGNGVNKHISYFMQVACLLRCSTEHRGCRS